MTKRTFGGTSRKRKRVSGFRVRMRSHTLVEELLKVEGKKEGKDSRLNNKNNGLA